MFFGRTRSSGPNPLKQVKLKLLVDGPTIINDPNGAKVTTAEPSRFRLNYGATIDPGIDTFMLTREQIDQIQKDVLVKLSAQDATVNAGAEIMVNNTISRVEMGSKKIITSIQSVRRLTHPDVLMLIDMKQNPDFYVPTKSTFFKQFKVLADKVLDLSFCALAFTADAGIKGLSITNRDKPATVYLFVDSTKDVTRGMDQFCYHLPNLNYTSPYVNFSVIPNDANYTQVRFPTRFNRATEQMEKIPKTDFLNTYLFYVNELFNTYRRYLRLIGHSARLEPVDVAAFDLPDDDDDDDEADLPEQLDSEAKAVLEQGREIIDEYEKPSALMQKLEQERSEIAAIQAERAAESGSSSSSDMPSVSGNEPVLPVDRPAGEEVEQKGPPPLPPSISLSATEEKNFSNMKQLTKPNDFIKPDTTFNELVNLFREKNSEEKLQILDAVTINSRIRKEKRGTVVGERVDVNLGEFIRLAKGSKKALEGNANTFSKFLLSKFSEPDYINSSKLAKKLY